MQLRKTMRQAAKMRLALTGASGAGKTYSSLLIAYGMTSYRFRELFSRSVCSPWAIQCTYSRQLLARDLY